MKAVSASQTVEAKHSSYLTLGDEQIIVLKYVTFFIQLFQFLYNSKGEYLNVSLFQEFILELSV